MKTLSGIVLSLLVLSSIDAVAQDSIAIVAHRGYWNCEDGGYSNNSRASLSRAISGGFWGSEFDVNMTEDEQLMVYHDGSVSGMKFCERNAADFKDCLLPNGETIPTLDEYLDIFSGSDCNMVFELKPHPTTQMETRAVTLCIEKLKAHGLFDPSRLIFISFSLYECALFARLAPGFPVQYLGNFEGLTPAILNDAGINGVDSHMGVFYNNPGWITGARQLGMSVNIWTVDTEQDIKRAISMGVDYITTNEPEKVRNMLKEMSVKENTPIPTR